MRLKIATRKSPDSREWQEHFAWTPVAIEDDGALYMVWLETVYKRRTSAQGIEDWEYSFPVTYA